MFELFLIRIFVAAPHRVSKQRPADEHGPETDVPVLHLARARAEGAGEWKGRGGPDTDADVHLNPAAFPVASSLWATEATSAESTHASIRLESRCTDDENDIDDDDYNDDDVNDDGDVFKKPTEA